jgi:hypothetical protein
MARSLAIGALYECGSGHVSDYTVVPFTLYKCSQLQLQGGAANFLP